MEYPDLTSLKSSTSRELKYLNIYQVDKKERKWRNNAINRQTTQLKNQGNKQSSNWQSKLIG